MKEEENKEVEFYSKEDFKNIRKHIDNIFNDESLQEFHIKKSTYEWSSKNDWTIHVELKLNWTSRYSSEPEHLLELTKHLFDRVYEFVKNKEFNMKFINVTSKDGFGFVFTFRPLIIEAQRLLSK